MGTNPPMLQIYRFFHKSNLWRTKKLPKCLRVILWRKFCKSEKLRYLCGAKQGEAPTIIHTAMCTCGATSVRNRLGKMAEWSNAAVLKTVEQRCSGGSNPSLSATKILQRRLLNGSRFFVCRPPMSSLIKAAYKQKRRATQRLAFCKIFEH